MLAAGSVADGLAATELVEPPELAAVAEPVVPVEDVVVCGVGRLSEVQAAVASSARPATRTDNRVVRRVTCTP